MLGPRGNPQLRTLFSITLYLQEQEGAALHVMREARRAGRSSATATRNGKDGLAAV